jgi:hypothetical protein
MFIHQVLQLRVNQRMTMVKAQEHEWFKSSQEDLELLYDQVVIRGIHNAGPVSDDEDS